MTWTCARTKVNQNNATHPVGCRSSAVRNSHVALMFLTETLYLPYRSRIAVRPRLPRGRGRCDAARRQYTGIHDRTRCDAKQRAGMVCQKPRRFTERATMY